MNAAQRALRESHRRMNHPAFHLEVPKCDPNCRCHGIAKPTVLRRIVNFFLARPN